MKKTSLSIEHIFTLKSFSILTTHPRIKSDEKLIETKLKAQNKNGCYSQV